MFLKELTPVYEQLVAFNTHVREMLDKAAGRSRTANCGCSISSWSAFSISSYSPHTPATLSAANLYSGLDSSIQRRWPLPLCQMYPSLSSGIWKTEAGIVL